MIWSVDRVFSSREKGLFHRSRYRLVLSWRLTPSPTSTAPPNDTKV
jgi:hypothetical protein